jgi:hypothetical protein
MQVIAFILEVFGLVRAVRFELDRLECRLVEPLLFFREIGMCKGIFFIFSSPDVHMVGLNVAFPTCC